MTRSKLSTILVLCFAIVGSLALLHSQPTSKAQGTPPQPPTNEIAALRAEIEVLKGKAVDQAHVTIVDSLHEKSFRFIRPRGARCQPA